MSRKSVTAVLEAADRAGLTWDEVKARCDGEAYEFVFPGQGEHQSVFAQLDWERVHKELARVGVTFVGGHGKLPIDGQ